MSIVAAFHWNGSNEKSISYMIIDGNFNLRAGPTLKTLNSQNFNLFKKEAEQAVKEFFDEIETLHKGKDCEIKLEYKVVNQATPVRQYSTRLNKPSKWTEFVDKKFREFFALKNKIIGSLQLAKQYRRKLKKPELDHFKEKICGLNIVAANGKTAYQHHLWAIALHATKSNYQQKLRKLTKSIIAKQGIEQGVKKRRAG